MTERVVKADPKPITSASLLAALVPGDGIIIDGVPGSGVDPFSSLLAAGTGISVSYNSGNRVWTVAATGGGGGSVSDGDKGDIVVSSSGAVWTIDSLAVTNAKINDVAWSKITGTPTTLSGYGISDAQPLDSDLTAIAALSTTSFGRSLLTQTDAAAARTTLGAGTSSFDGAYSSLSGIPSTFTPAAHNHTANEITSGTLDIARIPTGTSAITVCIGNDSRLSDARTPTSHVHGNISNAGAIGSTANLPIITTTSGVLTTGSFGSTANTFCEGNDARLSDARTPLAHNQAWSTITSTPTTLAGYGITDSVALTTGNLSQFAATTSSQLAGVISDETGSGALVFATSPTLTTPNIGTATGTSLALSGNSTSSTPATHLTGTWFTGGTTTTTKPHLLVEPAGATSTAWSTNGTGIGVNAASGFGGDLIRLQVNGSNRFRVDSAGDIHSAIGLHIPTTFSFYGGGAPAYLFRNDGNVTTRSNGSYGFTDSSSHSGTGNFNGRISRQSDGILQIGTTANNAAGSLALTNLIASGTVTVGGGTAVASVLSATATLDFGSIAASSFEDLTITVTGAASGDTVIVNPVAGSATTDVVYTGWVSASNTVTVRASNVSATTARDPASGLFRATVIRF